MGKILAVCSGSGGVGKSTVASCAALISAKRGLKTILLDASGISRACDLMLGMESVVVVDMMDVVAHQTMLQNALYQVPGEDNLLFSCASLYEGIALSDLASIILALRAMSDLLIIDLPTGQPRIGHELLDKDDALLLITRPDDVSIRALERVLRGISDTVCAQFHLVINRMDPAAIKKKRQYTVQTVEMLLDLPVSCALHEEESIHEMDGRGKRIPVRVPRLRSEVEKLLDQVRIEK